MLTVLLANFTTCKFYCCYLYCRIPLLAKSTAYITLNFHYLQIQPLLPLLLTSITCKFNPLYCQNQLLANSAPPIVYVLENYHPKFANLLAPPTDGTA